jgi:hypothetical protein
VTREPNRDERRLSDVDLTTSSAASMPFEALAETHDDVRVAFVSFDDFYRTHRTSVARALALTLRDVDLATPSRTHRDGELRRAGTEGDDGQAQHQR